MQDTEPIVYYSEIGKMLFVALLRFCLAVLLLHSSIFILLLYKDTYDTGLILFRYLIYKPNGVFF